MVVLVSDMTTTVTMASESDIEGYRVKPDQQRNWRFDHCGELRWCRASLPERKWFFENSAFKGLREKPIIP